MHKLCRGIRGKASLVCASLQRPESRQGPRLRLQLFVPGTLALGLVDVVVDSVIGALLVAVFALPSLVALALVDGDHTACIQAHTYESHEPRTQAVGPKGEAEGALVPLASVLCARAPGSMPRRVEGAF